MIFSLRATSLALMHYAYNGGECGEVVILALPY